MSIYDRPKKAAFSSEAKLCETFLWSLDKTIWRVFAETGGFDILLVRIADDVQVGIEAKLTLNAKVIEQIVESRSHWHVAEGAPDYRAALIPYGTTGSFGLICALLGITVIEQKDKAVWEYEAGRHYGHHRRSENTPKFEPKLPAIKEDHWSNWHDDWIDWAPAKRVTLPDYVPDVGAGHSAPVQLTSWKIKALKICAIIEKRGYVERADFKHLQISAERWLNPYVGWLERGPFKGQYVEGSKVRELRAQHPKNYAEIVADYEKWKPADDGKSPA